MYIYIYIYIYKDVHRGRTLNLTRIFNADFQGKHRMNQFVFLPDSGLTLFSQDEFIT